MRSDRGIRKMDAAKEALVQVLEKLSAGRGGRHCLAERATGRDPWIVPLGPVEINQARQAIQQAEANGGTPLGEFMKIGADALLQARAQAHYGEFRLLVVTDGENTQGLPPRVLLARYHVPRADGGCDWRRPAGRPQPGHASPLVSPRGRSGVATAGGATSICRDVGRRRCHIPEDFELLEGLPVDVAAAALAALADVGNRTHSGGGSRPATGQRLDSGPGPANRRARKLVAGPDRVADHCCGA